MILRMMLRRGEPARRPGASHRTGHRPAVLIMRIDSP